MSDYAELFESLQQQSILSEADLSKLRGLSELSYASLPNYEQRKRDSQLKELESRVPKVHKAKTRFGAKKTVKAEETLSISPAVDGSEVSWTEIALLKVNSSANVNLSHLRSCLVNYRDQPVSSVAHLNDLYNCVIILPVISGSVFMEQCSNCLLVCACQQLRMHSSTDVDVWIHVETDPIIEKCQRIRFSESPVEQHQLSSVLSHHAAVQDFDRPAHAFINQEQNWSLYEPSSAMQSSLRVLLDDNKGRPYPDKALLATSMTMLPKALQ